MTVRGSLRVGIGRIGEIHNTALYVERAARAAGHDVILVRDASALPGLARVDLFLAIDPWFEGAHALPQITCPTAILLIDVHRDLPTRALFARFFDHVFVAQRDHVERIAATGHPSVHWLPLAGDPGVHCVPGQTRDIDVGFVGKLGPPGSDRHAVLSHVLSGFATNAYARPHTPWEMGRIYSRSRIVFNKSIGGDVNMRVFEALAAGALLVTDRVTNGLEALLTEGQHYVGYDTAEEAVARITHYLGDEAARSRIARSGQALLLDRHTYDARFADVLDVVRRAGTARPAPARAVSKAERRVWRAQWARRRGITVAGATDLLAEGLSPVGYPDLALGLARGMKRSLQGLRP